MQFISATSGFNRPLMIPLPNEIKFWRLEEKRKEEKKEKKKKKEERRDMREEDNSTRANCTA